MAKSGKEVLVTSPIQVHCTLPDALNDIKLEIRGRWDSLKAGALEVDRGVNFWLVSEPGVGKTSRLQQLEKDPDYPCTVLPIDCSTLCVGELGGIVVPVTGDRGDIQKAIKVGLEGLLPLPPQETMSLPTEWLMILLMKLGTGLKIHNGEMKRICKLKTDDLDAQLRNFYFEPDEIDYKVFENPLSYKMIGAYEILGPDKISEDLVIPDAHYQEIFAYLMNMDDKQIADNKISANVEFLKKVIFSK